LSETKGEVVKEQRTLKKGMEVRYMRVTAGAAQALQCPGSSITSSGAVYRENRVSACSPSRRASPRWAAAAPTGADP
jgi:hypothetical protein